MKLATLIKSAFTARKPVKARSYEAAALSRLNGDWLAPNTSADAELFNSAERVRNRARELERNNEFARRYLDCLEANVLGHNGITLQSKVKDPSGLYDTYANRAVEDSWARWGTRGNTTPCGCLSWLSVQRLVLRRCATDGSVLIRKIKSVDAPFGFQLQVIEIDRLLYTLHSVNPQTGNQVRFGIEFDKYGKPLVYNIRRQHPGDLFGAVSMSSGQADQIQADEILHVYLPDRPGQSLGASWFAPVMVSLENLHKYREAELYAARMGACQMGFIERQQGAAEFSGDAPDSLGNKTMDAEPGVIRELDPGQSFKAFNPAHPTSAFSDFVKGQLRGIASGLSVSYVSLANDYSDVNYSSARSSLLEERERWKFLQEWFIDAFIEPIWNEWLPAALMKNQIIGPSGVAMPFSKKEKFNAPKWCARRWDWVDPEKDVNAAILAMKNGLLSRREVVANRGGDLEDVMEEQQGDKQIAIEYGILTPEMVAEAEQQKQIMDAYGVGVRAGCITPNVEDEKFIRTKVQLPAPSKDVQAAWKTDGGARKPITLQSGDKVAGNPANPEPAKTNKPAEKPEPITA